MLCDLLVGRQGAQAQRLSVQYDAAQVGEAVDRDDAAGERRLALTRPDHEVGAACDGTRAVRQGRERVLDGLGGGVRLRHGRAAQTRSGVIGSSRTRAPTTFAMAFPIAPAVGTLRGSPTPLEPRRPPFSAGFSTQSPSILGTPDAVA